MDHLTFVAETIKAVAWPVAAAVVLLSFRTPLVTLLNSLKSLKYGEIEAGFGERVRQAKEEALASMENAPGSPLTIAAAGEKAAQQAAALVMADIQKDADRIRAKFEDLLAISPAAAISQAWT